MKETTKALIAAACERERLRPPVKRLCIIQESGFQLRTPTEHNIHCFIPFDDMGFGKEELARLNAQGGLPYYLSWVEVKLLPERIA